MSTRRTNSLLFALLLVLSTFSTAIAEVTIKLEAGDHDRQGTPLSVEIPAALRDHARLSLTRLDTGAQVACQVAPGRAPQLGWILDEALPAGQTRSYRLTPKSPDKIATAGVVVRQDQTALRVSVSGKLVLVYNTAVVPAPNRKEAYYDRSGYIHPLYNPSGQQVTDDFAADHAHQHGLMFSWTNTTFEGRAVNFWDQKNQRGKVEHAEIDSRRSGSVFGEFTVRLKHLDTTTPDSQKPVLNEAWRVRVYNRTEYFLFDLRSEQACVGSPLHINEYDYGGLAIRGHRNWLTPGQGDFLTSEGKTRANGNHSRPRWVDIHGYVDGETTGVTILCHPENFRAPQPVRLHPNKPYFCFAPMVLGDFAIEPGLPYVSRYRFCVHDGKLDPQLGEQLWRDLSDPPAVRIE